MQDRNRQCPQDTVKDALKQLRENTVFIDINGDNDALLSAYLALPKKTLSFNEFLAKKFAKDHPGKVIVGRIQNCHDTLRFACVDDLKGADFSGCHFINVDFESDLTSVSFRNCYFKDATFYMAGMDSIDLRGAKISNCKFMDYDQETVKVHGLKLGFANHRKAQELGIIDIRKDRAMHAESRKAAQRIEHDLQLELKRIQQEFNTAMGLSGRFVGMVISNNPDLRKQKEAKQAQARQGAAEALSKALEELKATHVKEIICVKADPMYTANMTPDEVNQERIPITATRENLVNYVRHCHSSKCSTQSRESFLDYMIALKNVQKEDNKFYYVDISGQDCSDIDLADCNLARVNFAYCNLTGVDFARANLQGSCLEGAELSGANFTGAQAQFAKFTGTKSTAENHVIFKNAILTGASFMKAELPYADFTGAHLYSIDAFGIQAQHADMSSADAEFTDFCSGNLEYICARFLKAPGSCWEHANARGADLTQSVLDGVEAEGVDLSGSTLTLVSAQESKLSKAKLDSAQMQDMDLRSADIRGASAVSADMSGSKVDGLVYDEHTNLLFARLIGITGDKAEELQQFQKETMDKLRENSWFAVSKYGVPLTGSDGAAARREAQKLGAKVLIAGSSAFGTMLITGNTMFSGFTGVAIGSLLSEPSLEAMINLQNKADTAAAREQFPSTPEIELDYLNNAIGDRLAEVGLIAQAMGVDAGNIPLSVAQTLFNTTCTTGLIAGRAGVSTVISTLLGPVFPQYAQSYGSIVYQVGSQLLEVLSTNSLHLIYSLRTAEVISRLSNYDPTKDAGTDIISTLYYENKKQYEQYGFYTRFMPTKMKLTSGTWCGVLAAGAVLALPIVTLITLKCSAFTILATLPCLITPALAAFSIGFVAGYAYGDTLMKSICQFSHDVEETITLFFREIGDNLNIKNNSLSTVSEALSI